MGTYNYSKPYVQHDHPSYRQIVDLADWNHSCFIQSVGQSANVFSRHYEDLMVLQEHGAYIPMWFNRPIQNSKRLQLCPEKKV